MFGLSKKQKRINSDKLIDEGNNLINQGGLKEAYKKFSKAYTLNPKMDSSPLVDVCLQLANQHIQVGGDELRLAEHYLMEILTIYENIPPYSDNERNPKVFNAYAKLYDLKGETDKAKEYQDEAHRLSPILRQPRRPYK